MTTIAERFAQLIEALGMNESSFAKTIDKSRSMIGLVVNGKSKPGFEFLELVCTKFPKVSRDWLLAGEGTMFRDKPLLESDTYLREHLRALEENFVRLASQLETKDHQLESKDKQIEGLQRTVDALITRPTPALGKPNGVTAHRPVTIIHPATLRVINGMPATA